MLLRRLGKVVFGGYKKSAPKGASVSCCCSVAGSDVPLMIATVLVVVLAVVTLAVSFAAMTVGVGLVCLLPRLLWWWKSESMT